jgi:hypothetical protein
MTKKHIYNTNELPDNLLEEFEDTRIEILKSIVLLLDKYQPIIVNAGIAKAHIDFLKIVSRENLKEVLLNTSDYFAKAAENVDEK